MSRTVTEHQRKWDRLQKGAQLSRLLSRLMHEHGVTQDALAAACGLKGRSQVARWCDPNDLAQPNAAAIAMFPDSIRARYLTGVVGSGYLVRKDKRDAEAPSGASVARLIRELSDVAATAAEAAADGVWSDLELAAQRKENREARERIDAFDKWCADEQESRREIRSARG